jgi:hypothetical protein
MDHRVRLRFQGNDRTGTPGESPDTGREPVYIAIFRWLNPTRDDDWLTEPRNQDMNEHIKAMNDSGSDLDRPEDILTPEISDEELEAATAGQAITAYTAGGWMSSTPQCCNF